VLLYSPIGTCKPERGSQEATSLCPDVIVDRADKPGQRTTPAQHCQLNNTSLPRSPASSGNCMTSPTVMINGTETGYGRAIWGSCPAT
jgi:hypothetical protein